MGERKGSALDPLKELLERSSLRILKNFEKGGMDDEWIRGAGEGNLRRRGVL
jgi:hypothetical protein